MPALFKASSLGVSFLVVLIPTAAQRKQPTAAELSKTETPGKALMRTFADQEYEFRSAAEAMPEAKWTYRPARGLFKNEKPEIRARRGAHVCRAGEARRLLELRLRRRA